MVHKTLRMALLRSVVATAFVLLASMAQATFWGGGFDPPFLSGTHVFEVNGSDCFATDGATYVNNGDINNCRVSLNHLTVTLDHLLPTEQALDTSAIHFPDFADIWGIDVVGGQLVGVDSFLIGPLTGTSPYQGPWWIEYVSGAFDPVNLYDCNPKALSCLRSTAPIVTFFLSDANGNPIPEPGSLLLIAGALGAGWLARRRFAASN